MEAFAGHQGAWSGSNRFRLTPVDDPHVAPAVADVRVAAGGNLVVFSYTWAHADDGSQDGLLVVGPDEEPPGLVGLWGDSWHQSPAAKCLTGTIDAAVLTFAYTYGDAWEWIIAVDATDPDVLRLRMDNVVPAAAAAQGYTPGAYWAMDAELRRRGPV